MDTLNQERSSRMQVEVPASMNSCKVGSQAAKGLGKLERSGYKLKRGFLKLKVLFRDRVVPHHPPVPIAHHSLERKLFPW